MRIVTIGLGLSILGGTAVFAAEGNPLTGVGVSVESSPGGIVTTYANEAEARAACTKSGGDYTPAEGRAVGDKSPDAVALRKGRGICIGRGGGSFLPVQPKPVATPSPAITISGTEKTAAKPN